MKSSITKNYKKRAVAKVEQTDPEDGEILETIAKTKTQIAKINKTLEEIKGCDYASAELLKQMRKSI